MVLTKRVTAAAKVCYNEAIQVAFKGGYFASIINIALAIFGVSTLYLVMYFYLTLKFGVTKVDIQYLHYIPMLLIGYGFGASFVAMFA